MSSSSTNEINENEKTKNSKNNNENSSDEENEKLLPNEEEIKKMFSNNQNFHTDNINPSEENDLLVIREKIQKMKNKKLSSDSLLKNSKFNEAINSYKSTIDLLISEIGGIAVNEEILDSIKDEILIPCYQNIAFSYMKQKKWLRAKTYCKRVLSHEPNNIKAKYRLCLSNIHLGHLKKADNQLEELEKLIGGTKELEELEKIFEVNKLNSEGNNGEFLRKMGRKLRSGKINMYKDKKSVVENEKENNKKEGDSKWDIIKNQFWRLLCCCSKKKKSKSK